jgi:hypothetical protein
MPVIRRNPVAETLDAADMHGIDAAEAIEEYATLLAKVAGLEASRDQLRGAVSWNDRVADAAQVCAELASAAEAADDDESAKVLDAAVRVLDRGWKMRGDRMADHQTERLAAQRGAQGGSPDLPGGLRVSAHSDQSASERPAWDERDLWNFVDFCAHGMTTDQTPAEDFARAVRSRARTMLADRLAFDEGER